MAKNSKPATEYAQPHTMEGKTTNVETYSKYGTGAECMNEMNISVGGISKGKYPPENPCGVGEMRGYGAAIKGRKTSGKMG